MKPWASVCSAATAVTESAAAVICGANRALAAVVAAASLAARVAAAWRSASAAAARAVAAAAAARASAACAAALGSRCFRFSAVRRLALVTMAVASVLRSWMAVALAAPGRPLDAATFAL